MFWLGLALILVAEAVALVLFSRIAPDTRVFLLTPIVPLTLVVAFIVYSKLDELSYKARRLSPEVIASHRNRRPATDSPEELSRSIVERATEIQRTLAESPSEIRIEMCALGYRACVNDMITLTHLSNEELPNANFLRRFKLRRARKKATDALAGAREALPPGALRTTRQEHQ
jgi:hypothetical protein